jgi:hypothetical protein
MLAKRMLWLPPTAVNENVLRAALNNPYVREPRFTRVDTARNARALIQTAH